MVIPWTSSFWELLSVYNLKLKETNLCLPTDGILSKYLTFLTFPSSNLQHTGDKSSLSPSTDHYPSCFFALLLPYTSLPIWPEMYRNILYLFSKPSASLYPIHWPSLLCQPLNLDQYNYLSSLCYSLAIMEEIFKVGYRKTQLEMWVRPKAVLSNASRPINPKSYSVHLPITSNASIFPS